jgi:hypothetical protein
MVVVPKNIKSFDIGLIKAISLACLLLIVYGFEPPPNCSVSSYRMLVQMSPLILII